MKKSYKFLSTSGKLEIWSMCCFIKQIDPHKEPQWRLMIKSQKLIRNIVTQFLPRGSPRYACVFFNFTEGLKKMQRQWRQGLLKKSLILIGSVRNGRTHKVILVHILNNEPQCLQFQPQVTFMLGEKWCMSVSCSTASNRWVPGLAAVVLLATVYISLVDSLICDAPAGKANPKCTIPDEDIWSYKAHEAKSHQTRCKLGLIFIGVIYFSSLTVQ